MEFSVLNHDSEFKVLEIGFGQIGSYCRPDLIFFGNEKEISQLAAKKQQHANNAAAKPPQR